MKKTANRGPLRRIGPATWLLVLVVAAAIAALGLWLDLRAHDSPQVVAAAPASIPSFGPTIVNQSSAPAGTPQGMVWIPGGEFSMGANDPADMDPVGMNATTDARPIHKYSGRRFDVVVADGIGALRLLTNHPPEFLRDTPAVFLSVALNNGIPTLPPNITGVATHVDYAGTIRLARTLQPHLQHIYYINGQPLDNAPAKNEMLQNEVRSARDRLEISFWDHDDLGSLLKKVGSLPPHSPVRHLLRRC